MTKMIPVRWEPLLDDYEAEFDDDPDEKRTTLDRLAVSDASGSVGAEAIRGDRSILRAMVGWLCVIALALMTVAAFLL